MEIKRNEVADPEWDEGDYAVRSKEDLFSEERWRKTVDWDIILKQAEKTRQASQIASILMKLDRFKLYFFFIYYNQFPFSKLLEMFRQSEKAQTDYIEPWRHDFGGTRDSLIAKMEKDTELGPWVHRYDHLALDNHVPFWLLSGTKNFNGSVDKEAYLNTDNWLSILTIAAVLQEYDELHQADSEADEDCDEDILLKLELYFKDEASTQRFLKSVKDMNDTEIITLVKKYWQAGLCTDASKNLWRVLYEANLYKATYANWNKQVVIRKK